MKHKFPKRSISNKQFRQQTYPIQIRRTSISIEISRTISSNQIDYNSDIVHVPSDTACLKPHGHLKSQKQLKRDLLRCSNQRLNLHGVQTVSTPRHHRPLKQTHSLASSSSTSSSFDRRRRSLSNHSHIFYATIDRFGPWSNISTNRLRSNGNDLLRPLKNFRSTKNPRIFSPKYYASLAENTNQFKFYSSNRSYIEEYRKQKGYILVPNSTEKQMTSLSISSSLKRDDDDQISVMGSFSGEQGSCTNRDLTDLSTARIPLSTRAKTRSVDDLLKYYDEQLSTGVSTNNSSNMLPSIFTQNNNNDNNIHAFRMIRHAQQQHRHHHHQQQTISLPPINKTFRYLNSIQAVEKAYLERKKPSKGNHSKLYLIDGRPSKKRTLSRLSKISEVSADPQGHIGSRASGSSVVTIINKSPSSVAVVYQLPRRTQPVTT